MTIISTTSATSSGLDVNGIVSQLMAVEQLPITQMDNKVTSYQAQLSAYGTIKGAVSSFQTAVQGLSTTAQFGSLLATPSDPTVFTANASSIAKPGNYTLEVSSLAQSQQLVAAGKADSTTAIGTGVTTTINFDFGTISGGSLTAFDPNTNTGGTYSGASFTSSGNPVNSITIDSSNNTLQGIRDAINAANVGVTATIVNDGSSNPYRLSLSSDNLGVGNSMKISVSGDSAVSNLLANDPAGTQNLSQTITAANANLKVNGLAVSKPSNSISDVIQGVTLTLTNKTTSPVSLTVANDSSSMSTAIGSFVKAYNDLYTNLKTLSAYDPATQLGAVLQGDSTVRTLQTQLRSMMSASTGDSSNTLRTLTDLGVTFQLDGTLSVDQTKLGSAMTNHFGDIATMFTSANGYATKLNSWTTSILASDGALTSRSDSLSKTITDIGNQKSALQARLVSVQKRYQTQYSALDAMLTSMNQTSTYLTQQFAALSNTK